MHTTSASLLQRLREPKGPDDWTRFVQLYTPLLFHWMQKWGLQPQDAADLVQEVFVTLLQKLPDLPPELEYRIVGRHIVLLDVTANVIVDVARNIVPTLPS